LDLADLLVDDRVAAGCVGCRMLIGGVLAQVVAGGLDPVAAAGLRVDVGQVALDGVVGDAEASADLGGAFAGCDEREDLDFATGERIAPAGAPSGGCAAHVCAPGGRVDGRLLWRRSPLGRGPGGRGRALASVLA
jgi:hypothetical protein